MQKPRLKMVFAQNKTTKVVTDAKKHPRATDIDAIGVVRDLVRKGREEGKSQ